MFNGIEFTWEELQPVFVSIQLAVLTTIFLVILVTPLAWWLSRKKTTARSVILSSLLNVSSTGTPFFSNPLIF